MRDGLYDLIKLLPTSITMVEIGCFAGESTTMFMSSLKINKLYAVDAWQNGLDKNDITTVQYDLEDVEKTFDTNMFDWVVDGKVEKVKGNSLEVYDKFSDNSLDFIYIDSCHEYGHVKGELELYWPKVKVGGIIGGHDYNSCYGGITQAVDEFFFNGPDKTFCDFSWVKYKG